MSHPIPGHDYDEPTVEGEPTQNELVSVWDELNRGIQYVEFNNPNDIF